MRNQRARIDVKKLIVRLSKPSDLSQILSIEHISFSLDAFSKRTFMIWYRQCSDFFFVAEMNEKIVGYMITCVFQDKGYVVSIAVDPDCRHRGIGGTLANFTFKKLVERDIKMVELEVRFTNMEGMNFWKHLGFFPIKVVPKYYNDGESALRMRKILNQKEEF